MKVPESHDQDPGTTGAMVSGPPTAPRALGRPRDDGARRAVLDAALALAADDVGALSIDAIARRAGVSRPTIYRWWPTKGAVVLEALREATAVAAPYPDTGCVRGDVQEQMHRYVEVLTGPLAPAYRSAFADAQRDQGAAAELRAALIEPRRALTREVLERGIASSELRRDLDLDVTIDALYGPLLYRLLLGHAPLDAAAVDALVAHVHDGIAG